MSIWENDFDSPSEYVRIYFNDEYLGKCNELNEDCTSNWTNCGVVNQYYNNTRYLLSGTQITLTRIASQYVDHCPYNKNDTDYYLRSQLTIDCDDYSQYEYSLNAALSNVATKQFECEDFGCSVDWEIIDDCIIPTISISIHNTTSNVNIFINQHSLGACEYNQDNDNYNYASDWINCQNVDEYPIYDYLRFSDTYDEKSTSDHLFVYLASADDYNHTNFWAAITIECKRPEPDYNFGLGLSGTYEWPRDDINVDGGKIGCEKGDYDNRCDISKLWQISGICKRPKLDIKVMDMNYTFGSVTIDINGDQNKIQCSNSQDPNSCSDPREWFTCADNYDLSHYIDTSADLENINYINLFIKTDDMIETLCPWNDYYLYVEVSLSCFVPDQCILDSDLPQIITMILIVLSISTAVGVIVAGTFAAYKKAQEKVLIQDLQKSVGSNSETPCKTTSDDESSIQIDYGIDVITNMSINDWQTDTSLDMKHQWICDRCLFVNPIILQFCEKCGIVRVKRENKKSGPNQLNSNKMVNATSNATSNLSLEDMIEIEYDHNVGEISGQSTTNNEKINVSVSKVHGTVTTGVNDSRIFCSFCKYLPKEIMRKKSCYFPCVTHLVDQATDFAVIFEFYQLYVFESIPNPNGTKNDCSGVDAHQLLILSCIAFMFYRIISCIWILNITRSLFHTLLQFFDLKIYHALYINFISEYNDGTPNAAQKYIQILEASLEAFPQVVIQLYFFIQVKMDIGKYWVIFASLIISLYNVSNKMAGEDKIYFIKSWQNVFVGHYKMNFRYLFRYIVRVCDVFQRIMLILLLWIGIGGFYCALYIVFEMFILSCLSFATKEYVMCLQIYV